jgi:hypothetical protein
MIPEDKKFERLLSILKNSKPVLGSTDDIEEKVISRLQHSSKKDNKPSNILDYIFGWVYIGWVRTSFVAASILIVVLFAYQQTVILTRVNTLSQQAIVTESQMVSGGSNDLEVKLLMYKLSGRKLSTDRNSLTEKQMDELLESINELKVKYKDLIKLIEEDPDLKKEIEKKMAEKNMKKFNL